MTERPQEPEPQPVEPDVGDAVTEGDYQPLPVEPDPGDYDTYGRDDDYESR